MANQIARLAAVFAVVGLITWICFSVAHVNETTVGFLFLVAILLIAARWGLREAIVASLISVTCFNFFFLPPAGTFTISDPKNWVALFAFLATSITASHLSTQAKRRAQEATARQHDMEKLYALSRALLLISPDSPVPKQLATQVVQSFGATAVALYSRDSGEVVRAGPEDFQDPSGQLQLAASQGTLFHETGSQSWITSIRLGAQPIASLGIRGVPLSDSVLQGLANLVAIGLERARVQDATSRAEAARQSDELKSTLLDALAHEFKTPLTSIKAASSSLLSTNNLQPSQQHELFSVIDEEAGRLAALVTEAIQMARIEAGRVQMNRDNYEVKKILESVMDKFNSIAKERSIGVRVPDNIPAVWVDRELIEIALRQLIDNALKYSPPGSAVAVDAEAAGGRVVVSVSDQGPGISEHDQDRIFEKFYRAEASRHQIPGAGLGLVIAREIIQIHGGEIWVESKPGTGSIFRFTLPLTGATKAA